MSERIEDKSKVIEDATSIYCDSGLSKGEAMFCNIHTTRFGNQLWGIHKIILNGINDITIIKGDTPLLAVGMKINKTFDKPTTCRYDIKNGRKVIECVPK